MKITNGQELTKALGQTTAFQKTQLMCKRDVKEGGETVEKWGETLTAERGVDYMLCKEGEDDDVYPCKIDIFNQTYAETEPGSGLYQKTAFTNAVQVPQGQEYDVVSLESDESSKAVYPNWIAVGAKDEVWVIGNDTIESDFKKVEVEAEAS